MQADDPQRPTRGRCLPALSVSSQLCPWLYCPLNRVHVRAGLDASEPEISTSDAGRAALDFNNSLGTGSEVGMMYPPAYSPCVCCD